MFEPNAAQAEFWDAITQSWLAVEEQSVRIAQPFGDLAMERLGLDPGDRVLDIGCGAGDTTFALARLVGATGTACGIDIAPGMIAAARAQAADAEVPQASFFAIDAQTADLHGPFDAAYSRFGVMFFTDPVAAFGNVASVVVREGRLALACWRSLFENEWMFVPGAAAIAVTGEFPPMPAPGEPGPFSLKDPDQLTAMLTAAGYEEIEVEPVTRVVALPESRLEEIVQLSAHVGPVHEALRTAGDDLSARILDAVREALQAKVVDGELQLTSAANVVTAQVSGWHR